MDNGVGIKGMNCLFWSWRELCVTCMALRAGWVLYLTCNIYHLPFFVLSFMGYILKLSYRSTLIAQSNTLQATDLPSTPFSAVTQPS